MDNNHNIDLVWEDFFEFFTLIFSTYELKTYSLTHYPSLMHLLISWELYKRKKAIPLVRGTKMYICNLLEIGTKTKINNHEFLCSSQTSKWHDESQDNPNKENILLNILIHAPIKKQNCYPSWL
jgi:hypothetical protein